MFASVNGKDGREIGIAGRRDTPAAETEAKLAINRDEKERALNEALAHIQKTFGKGAIMRLGDEGAISNIEAIPTGSVSLDIATGIGGIPRGRIVEIFGPESSGKTTLTLHIIAEAQRLGGKAAFIDAEHALDPEYAGKLGVNIDELLVSQPDTGEQALEICEMLVRSGAIDVVAVDSVAALVPRAEIQGEMGDSHVGLHARLMSQALRKLAGAINKSNTCAIFINQLREKVGVIYGSPEVTTGGRALKFYSSMRIDIRKTESIKSGDQMIGNRTRAKIVKNKVAPPFKQAEFDIMYGEGISKLGDLVDCAVTEKIIDKSGSWYSFEDSRIGQGRENVKAWLKENTDIAEKIETLVLDKINAKKKADAQDAGANGQGKPNGIADGSASGQSAPLAVDADGVVLEG
jgi:recombination protein RecA